eukprot:4513444-Pyramimonas_sp.AAC.1
MRYHFSSTWSSLHRTTVRRSDAVKTRFATFGSPAWAQRLCGSGGCLANVPAAKEERREYAPSR